MTCIKGSTNPDSKLFFSPQSGINRADSFVLNSPGSERSLFLFRSTRLMEFHFHSWKNLKKSSFSLLDRWSELPDSLVFISQKEE